MRHCLVCGKGFEPTRSTHLFCGHECNLRKWQEDHPRERIPPTQGTCVQCGESFVGKKGKLFCSMKCRWTYQNKNRPTTQEVERQCVVCGKGFFPKQLRGSGKTYCSDACRLVRRKVLRERRLAGNGEPDAKRKVLRKESLRVYGLSVSEYDAMLEKQGGVCAICRQPETARTRTGQPRPLCVDHCHKRGHVRKLLCVKCNSGLGWFRDDPALLRAAADYLEN